jgi:hypothetical protein
MLIICSQFVAFTFFLLTAPSPYKVKANLSLCLITSPLRHEGIRGTGCIHVFLTSALVGGEYLHPSTLHNTPQGFICTYAYVVPFFVRRNSVVYHHVSMTNLGVLRVK